MWAFFQRAGRDRRRRQADRALRRSHAGSTCNTGAPGATRGRTPRSSPRPTRRSRACAAAASFSPTGHGAKPSDLDPALDRQVRRLYEDAKLCIHADAARRHSRSSLARRGAGRNPQPRSRRLHPAPAHRRGAGRGVARRASAHCATRSAARSTCRSSSPTASTRWRSTDEGHLAPYLEELRRRLAGAGLKVAPRACARGQTAACAPATASARRCSAALAAARQPAVVHVIGERPGNGHHTFSAYITEAAGARLGAGGRRRSQSHPGDQQHRRHGSRATPCGATDGRAADSRCCWIAAPAGTEDQEIRRSGGWLAAPSIRRRGLRSRPAARPDRGARRIDRHASRPSASSPARRGRSRKFVTSLLNFCPPGLLFFHERSKLAMPPQAKHGALRRRYRTPAG